MPQSPRSQLQIRERDPVASELTGQFDAETLCEQDFIDAESYRGSLEFFLKAAKQTIPLRLTDLCRGMQHSLSDAHQAFRKGNLAVAAIHASHAKTSQTDLLVELNALCTGQTDNAKGVGTCVSACSALAKVISKLVVLGARNAPGGLLSMPRVASLPQLIEARSPRRSSPVRVQSPTRERERVESPTSPDDTRIKATIGSGPDYHRPDSPLRATFADAPHDVAQARSTKKRAPGGEHSPTLKKNQSPKRQKPSLPASSPLQGKMNRVPDALSPSPRPPGDGATGDKPKIFSVSPTWRPAHSSTRERRMSMTSMRSPTSGIDSPAVSPRRDNSSATAINTQTSGHPPSTASTPSTDIAASRSPKVPVLPALGSLSPVRSQHRKSMQLSPQPSPRRMTASALKPVDIETGMVSAVSAGTATVIAVKATDLFASDAPPLPRKTADVNGETVTSVNALAMPDFSGSGESRGEHA
jgi:hypothetical protein